MCLARRRYIKSLGLFVSKMAEREREREVFGLATDSPVLATVSNFGSQAMQLFSSDAKRVIFSAPSDRAPALVPVTTALG
ncbi:hypothetical protein [Sporisorium scitamineum]|uniref:Uncharacterized protein n=1 Tax=Sporisorium scitamineum TaxID=49012 RepID=A0A0F7S3R0_9BASI|nr:hypothetical protein [Sporisorium scitamineum]